MRFLSFFLAASVAVPVMADDLRGADRFLCSTLQATACGAEIECVSLPPPELNIPQFVQVDMPGKKLATTPASGENRTTPLQTVQREEGRIILQGHEAGRAFSLVIEEATGRASFASAADSRGVVVFAACTPLH